MGSILVGDLETDGLKPSKIYMVGILDLETDEYTAYIGDDEVPLGLIRLAEAECVIGHNFRLYDAPVIKKLTEGLVEIDSAKIVDTCEMSRKLFPDLKSHKLSLWGEILESPKIDYDKGFDAFHPDMIGYCKQDVVLNAKLFRFLSEVAAERQGT